MFENVVAESILYTFFNNISISQPSALFQQLDQFNIDRDGIKHIVNLNIYLKFLNLMIHPELHRRTNSVHVSKNFIIFIVYTITSWFSTIDCEEDGNKFCTLKHDKPKGQGQQYDVKIRGQKYHVKTSRSREMVIFRLLIFLDSGRAFVSLIPFTSI